MVNAIVCQVLEKYRPAISRNEKQIADYPPTARTRKESSLLTEECKESKIGKIETVVLFERWYNKFVYAVDFPSQEISEIKM